MSEYNACMRLLHDNWAKLPKKPKISVHVNLIDGRYLTTGKYIGSTWKHWFLRGIIPIGHEKLKTKLKEEIKAQIKRVYDDLPFGTELRVDSHVHTHMIPIVFDSMMEALEELNLTEKTEYLRVCREPLMPFLIYSDIRKTIPKINILKNIILNIFSLRAAKILNTKYPQITHGLLWGVITGGRMDYSRVSAMLPTMKRIAARKNMSLEIMLHPGIVGKEAHMDEYIEDDRKAFCSENRDAEYETLMKLER